MSDGTHPAVADVAAPAAPPRANGELVFEEPWESRVFGVALALHDEGLVDFETFRSRLIAAIGRSERAHVGDVPGYRYYERWLEALERTVIESSLVAPEALEGARVVLHDQWEHDHERS